MSRTRWEFVFAFAMLFHTVSLSQIDSTRMEFFPLHQGDLLQYTYGNQWGWTPFTRNQTIANPDTVMPNGRHYVKVVNSPYGDMTKYFRIDSLMRVQEYIYSSSTQYDSSAIINGETNVFRLNEHEGAVWKIGYNIETILSYYPYLFRYEGISTYQAFGQLRDIMVFGQGVFDVWRKDTTYWEGGCILMRGFGVYRIEYGENLFLQLTGAVINGKTYGLIRTGIDEDRAASRHFTLAQNYPNPFNPSTTISFSLPSQSFVSLKIFDVMGRDVAMIVSENLQAGSYQRHWNASGYPSGMYFYRLQAGSLAETKRLILIR